jgi:SAM-dependent methyltransferase
MNRQNGVETLLETYPRHRPPLPPAHQRIYVEHYRANRAGERGLSYLVRRLESWMHQKVAEGVRGSVLEIGAGNLNHLPYHSAAGAYDVVEPFRELWAGSPHLSRVRRIYSGIEEVPDHERYDAIVSTAVLEHLTDLPHVVARAALLLRLDGTFRAGFPSEGGLLWGLAWRLTTGLEFRIRRGLHYSAIMRHEHVNTAREILSVLEHFFESVTVSRFPLPSENLSFYTVAAARGPRIARCLDICASRLRLGTCAP